MGRATGLLVETAVRQLLGIDGNTKGSLDTWIESLSIAEQQDTSVVDLGLCNVMAISTYSKIVL